MELNEIFNIVIGFKSLQFIQVLVAIIGVIIGGYYAYRNYHKKPATVSKVSQSVNNSSGIVQQKDVIIEKQTIIYSDKKDGKVSESTRLKLKEIDTQLKDLYLPMDNYISYYIKTISAASNDTNLQDMHKVELDKKLRELRPKYPGQVDIQVIQFCDKFFKGICSAEAFQDAVGIKIRSLQTERENLINEFEEKGQ